MSLSMFDVKKRELTAQEARVLSVVRPELELLTVYLTDEGGWNTFRDAVIHEAALNTASTKTTSVSPIVVRLDYVVKWAEARGRHTTIGKVAAAVLFMGGVAVATFRAKGEPHRVRRFQGWMRLSSEAHDRLLLNIYVPVLTPGRGRVANQDALIEKMPPDALMDQHVNHERTLPTSKVLEVVRDYLTNGAPASSVLSVAVRYRAPLVLRRRGKPRKDLITNLRRDLILISDRGLSAHSGECSTRLNVVPLTETRARLALRRLALRSPAICAAVPSVRAVDTVTSVRSSSWYSINLTHAGVAVEPDLHVAAAEYALFYDWRETEVYRLGGPLTTAQMRPFIDFMQDRPV